MYLKCAHPDCLSDFNHGQGRLFRFQQTLPQEQQPSCWHGVKHFWLCARCCENYTIEYQKEVGLLLKQRLETLPGARPCYYVLQAESAAKPELPRRLSRSRGRRRKQNSELASAKARTIEAVENRIWERRRQSQ